MPNELSTPILLRVISKKEDFETHATIKPRILTTQDYTNIIDNAVNKQHPREGAGSSCTVSTISMSGRSRSSSLGSNVSNRSSSGPTYPEKDTSHANSRYSSEKVSREYSQNLSSGSAPSERRASSAGRNSSNVVFINQGNNSASRGDASSFGQNITHTPETNPRLSSVPESTNYTTIVGDSNATSTVTIPIRLVNNSTTVPTSTSSGTDVTAINTDKVVDDSRKRHIERMKEARQRKMESNKRNLPQVTEDMYRKMYGGRGQSEKGYDLVENPQQSHASNMNSNVTYNTVQNSTKSLVDGSRMSIQDTVTLLPSTPTPRQAAPRQEMMGNTKTNVSLVSKKRKTDSESTLKSPLQRQGITFKDRTTEATINTTRYSTQVEQMSEDGLDIEYKRVMESIESGELNHDRLPTRPVLLHEPYFMNHETSGTERNVDGDHHQDSGSEKSGRSGRSETPSIRRMYSHIDSMTKYLDDLSEPESLNICKTPPKGSANGGAATITSPDAHPRRNIPLQSSKEIRTRTPCLKEKLDAVVQSSPEGNHNYEEDILSSPSIQSPENLERLAMNARHRSPVGYILQHDEKVQVPTPSKVDSKSLFEKFSEATPEKLQEEEIDPQLLLEYGAPCSLQDLNFELDMPSFSDIGGMRSSSTDGLIGVDMNTMSLADVKNHIIVVCDNLNTALYTPLQEDLTTPTTNIQPNPSTLLTEIVPRSPAPHVNRFAPRYPHDRAFSFTASYEGASLGASSQIEMRQTLRKYIPAPRRTFLQYFRLWALNTSQCRALRAKRIHDLKTIQDKLIEVFFEKNASLFLKVENLREQIRREQATVVRVHLRTTKSQELRMKKNREGTDKPSTIRATIRSSQSSYNLTMWEDQCGRLIARIFLRFLRFLVELKKEKAHGLALIDQEEQATLLRNIFSMWQEYNARYRGENKKIRDMKRQSRRHLLKDSLSQMRFVLEKRLISQEQERVAISIANRSLKYQAFNSLQHRIVSRELDVLKNEMADRWNNLNHLATIFSLWRQQAQRGQVLKQKLLNFAFSKCEENDMIDEKQRAASLVLKLRIHEQFLQEYLPRCSSLQKRLSFLESRPRLHLPSESGMIDDDTSLSENTRPRQQVVDKENTLKQRSERSTGHFNSSDIRPLRTDRSIENAPSPSYNSAVSPKFKPIIENGSITEIADKSYTIKLLRKVIDQWRIVLQQVSMENHAVEFHNEKLKRKSMTIWSTRSQSLQEAEKKVSSICAQHTLRRFFSKWKKDTTTFVQLKDSIAQQCHEHHLQSRIFNSWRNYTTRRTIQGYNYLLVKQKREKSIKEKVIQHWRSRLNNKVINYEMEVIADKHYRYFLTAEVIGVWRQKLRNRQLLRRVFDRALQAYRQESSIPTGTLREEMLRRYFGNWKKRVRASNRVKKLKQQWVIAKQWHEKKLKERAIVAWSDLYRKQLQADALHYNFLLRRASKILHCWKMHTEVMKAKAQENELIEQIYDGLVQRRMFKRWRVVTVANRTRRQRAQEVIPAGPETQKQSSVRFEKSYKESSSQSDTAGDYQPQPHYGGTSLHHHPYAFNPHPHGYFETAEGNFFSAPAFVSSGDDFSYDSSNNSNKRSQRKLQEYRRLHEDMKSYKRQRVAEMSERFGREMSVAQIFFNKKLKLRIWKAWKSFVERRKMKVLLQERIDHFYNSKLHRMNIGRSVLSLDRLNAEVENLPVYFETTYRIVNYKILLKLFLNWKHYARKMKTQRIALSIAARFYRRKLLEQSMTKWRKKMDLIRKDDFTSHVTNFSSQQQTSYGSSYPSSQTHSGFSVVRFGPTTSYDPIYRPASVVASVASSKASSSSSLDKNQFGQPRKPFSIVTIPTGRVYDSP